ncbi:MAG TPA: sigma-70 family RNA polymerase sigma factor [Anaerolinea sp.]|nr:sigma-70 family RNA polymerase sigma factor [Anaerolinea sp.]
MELNIPSLFPVRARWDEAEYNRIFLEWYPRMCEIAFRIVADRDQAEDLAGESLWRLWSSPPAGRENIPGWLYRVTTHLAYNALRASARRVRYELQDSDADQTGVEEQVSRNEQIERVRKILRKMPRRDVQLLVLRYSGLSYQEIAAALKLAPGSIGTLLARAENRFASLHRKEEDDASR